MSRTVGPYRLKKQLGTGGSCVVWQAKHKEYPDHSVALKIIDIENAHDSIMDNFKIEVDCLNELDHPNIVKLLDSSEEATYTKRNGSTMDVAYLALELISGGELFDFVAEAGAFSEKVARYYFHQLISALCYMQEAGMSHRDLKLENILLTEDFQLKVADFGFASFVPNNATSRGTEGYMAPEICRNRVYNGEKVDIFAAGVILFTMVARRPPFVQAIPSDAYYKLISTNRPDVFWKVHCKNLPGKLSYFSDELKLLIQMMLAYDAKERPSLAEIVTSDWFNGDLPTEAEIKKEFTKRQQIVKKTNNIGSQPENVVGPSAFGASGAHRSGEEIKIPEGDREAGEYEEGVQRYTELFTTTSPQKLFELLCMYAQENTTKCEFDEKSYGATLSVSVEEGRNVTFRVNILKVDESNNCVQVIKEEGDRFAFSDVFRKVRDYFSGNQAEAH